MTEEQLQQFDQQARRSARQSRIMSIIAGGMLIVVFLAAVAMWIYVRSVQQGAVTLRDELQTDGNLTPTTDESAVSSAAEKASKSVVSIITNVEQQSSTFGLQQQQRAAAGTGLIVSKDGYIITNKHVVANASAIRVITADGTRYDDVQLVGKDPLNDIAYLKLEAGNAQLAALSLGDSATLRIGQSVIAIGNDLGRYQNTVTSGIVSGKGRPVIASMSNSSSQTESLTDLIQTDAAINSGNSGGPLLNRSGQVIGINVAVATNAQGISFAIPVNAVKGTLKSVLAGKGVRRAYLGARYTMLTPDIAKQAGISAKEGAYIIGNSGKDAIVADGPAAKAGLKEKDVITKINNLTVGKQGDVSSLIGEYQPGDTVEMTVQRDSKTIALRVTLGQYRASDEE